MTLIFSAGTPAIPELPPPFRVEHHDELSSTNQTAVERAKAGAGEGLVIRADRQTAGRGRLGRAWRSLSGNLFVSVVLQPERPVGEAAQLSFAAALAAADAIEAIAPGVDVGLKWPNDLQIGPAKIGGILLESSAQPDGGTDWIVVGIGVNVRDHPTDLDRPVTHLTDHVPGVTADDLFPVLICRLGAWVDQWRRDGFAPLRQAWRRRALGIGQPATANLAAGLVQGHVEDLDVDGALLLRRPTGQLDRIAAGDVFFATGED